MLYGTKQTMLVGTRLSQQNPTLCQSVVELFVIGLAEALCSLPFVERLT